MSDGKRVPGMAEQWWEEGRHTLAAIRKELRIANLLKLAEVMEDKNPEIAAEARERAMMELDI